MTAPERFKIQDEQYKFPYHHLVSFKPFNTYEVMPWGFEYYAYMSKVLELVCERQFRTLLDVGCGEGKMILELMKLCPGIEAKGIDLSERAIFFAKAFNFGNGATFAAEDIEKTAGTYDIITLVETMEHVPDHEISSIVSRVRARLGDGGVVIVTVPTVNFPLLSKHYRHYDISLIEKQFQGFKLESSWFMVKQGFTYKLLIRFTRKFCTFRFMRTLFFKIAKARLFEATPRNGRHLVCVFKKA